MDHDFYSLRRIVAELVDAAEFKPVDLLATIREDQRQTMREIRGASKTLKISVKDLEKRKAWLGRIMENADYTEEEEAHGVKMTERAKRARRANLNQ